MNELIKEIINEQLCGRKVDKILLFGSRARNDFNILSDYDILIILADEIQMNDRINLSTSIRKQFAEAGIDADIILKSRAEADYYQNKTGSIVKAAMKEGVVL